EDPPEDPPEVLMADNRTMAELLQAPTEGYEDAIVISEIAVNNFELKHGLINLVQNKEFFGHDKEDSHAHIRYFNKITSTMRVPNVPSSSIKLMLFPFSLEGAAWIWLEKEAPRSILTWDDLVTKFINQACLRHGFFELHQLDTFYNALNVNDQDSLNSAAGGNFLDKMPRECLKIVENKSKVCQSRAKAVVAKVSTSSSTPAVSSDVAELKDMVRALLLDKKNQSSAPAHSLTHAPVKAVKPNCVTCGGAHPYQNCPATSGNVYRDNIQDYVSQAAAANYNQGNTESGTLPSNTITNPKEDLKGITTRSRVAYQGPTIPTPSKVVEQGTEVTKDQVQTPSSQISVRMPNLKPSIPYPLRRDDERRRDQANEKIEKLYEIFKDMSFQISFTDALILMPKFASTLKALIGNKEKLSEMARTPMNEHCSAVILNKLPRKLGDPGKFLIPCEFPGMDEYLALADLGASINLMPLSVWEGLSLPELTPTCMTLELVDRSVSKPIGIAKDVSVKVGVFYFPADFMVVDFKPDSRVPLILRRCFLKTGRALIDVHKGELTFRIENEAITYNLDQTSRYSANYNQMTANKIDVICEEYSQEVLGFSDTTASGNPTPYDDSIVSTTSPTLTSFGDIDFLLFEEADAFLDILNSESLPPLLNHEQYLPSFKKELKVCEAKNVKSSVDEPPKVELKDLPPHLEYVFLEGDNKLPVIISKELGDEEKSALIKVEKLFDAGLIYPISDSPWVSLVHCVPKKGGFTFVENEENELIPARLVTGWRVCIDYRKLNKATRKDHFPLPFMDQMLERLAGNEYYYFLDGFSGYFQIPIDPRDQEKTTFTCPYETFAYRRMPFGLFNAPSTFQRCILAIFHDMVEKTMCEDTNLSLNWEKSHFMVKEGIVLGHKISKNGIEVDRAKVDDFSKISRPMTHLLEKNTLFIFSEDCIKAFQTLKKKLMEAPILIAPNWDLPFELMCDASDFGIGAVLGQHHEKHFRPIHYASKTMNDAESNYTTTEKEMLAVVFGAPRAIISDPGTHFCNDQFAKVMLKYGFTHRLSTAYHPQTSGQVEVSNRGLKRILERTIGENHASWSDKLDDALWAFRTAYKTPIGCTPYKHVYGKACHLPIELEHKTYWSLKQAKFDLPVAGDHRKVQLNELNELRDHAYENSLIYKEKTKRIHDSKIKNRVFNVGDLVLLFNSRLKIFSGKLKTRWSGPFTIAKVFPYDTVKLSQTNGPNFKVNGHRVKHYFRGDVPYLVVSDL
nr:reverse transcriptase domain-containing protein [Tanacetum cinerariifolium]